MSHNICLSLTHLTSLSMIISKSSMFLQMPYSFSCLSNIPILYLSGIYIYTYTQIGPNKAFAQPRKP